MSQQPDKTPQDPADPSATPAPEAEPTPPSPAPKSPPAAPGPAAPGTSTAGRRGQPAAAPPEAAPRFQLLSALLKGIPPEELHLVLEKYHDAIKRGTVKAVSAPSNLTFEVEVVTAQGKRAVRKVEDEIVLPDDGFQGWLAQERRASRLAVLRVTGRVETSLARLASGEDDFKTLLEIRRGRLQQPKAEKQKAGRAAS
ncbi:hypothetical protein [Deinococcus betulae]|uniref:hypothetical protein n=1 Tax=Deinococcus betulae TaxID=2873312 RepID=UPI0027148119|nr:hypothetical protein [Deinococcus betulae]